MSRPPPVALIARTHWLVGGAVAAAVVTLHLLTRGTPLAPNWKVYVISGALAGLFGVTGTLVWHGVTPGQYLSRFCALFYLLRPHLCFHLFDVMKTPEFKAHFGTSKPPPDPAGPPQP